MTRRTYASPVPSRSTRDHRGQRNQLDARKVVGLLELPDPEELGLVVYHPADGPTEVALGVISPVEQARLAPVTNIWAYPLDRKAC